MLREREGDWRISRGYDAGGARERVPGKRTMVERAMAGGGQTLPAQLQKKYEQSLGTDLGPVRVHTDDESAGAAKSMKARAYTIGADIYFAKGAYDPSGAGEHLLAHEVAHAAQSSGKTQFKLELGTPGDAAEVEADRAADAMVAGRPASVSDGGGVIRRFFDEFFEGWDSGAGDGGWEGEDWAEPGYGGEGPMDPQHIPQAAPPRDGYQHDSWYQPSPDPGLPHAEIYFPVDESQLDLDDDQAIRELIRDHGPDIAAGKVRVHLKGFADHRAGDEYNDDLARRRMDRVEGQMRLHLGGIGGPGAFNPTKEPIGENHLHHHDRDGMARARRVEIWLERAHEPSQPGNDEPPKGEEFFPMSDQWQFKVLRLLGTGIPGGLGMEVGEVRIMDTKTGKASTFGYSGSGAAGPGVDGPSEWVPFRTLAPVRVRDFEGVTSHTSSGAVLIGVDNWFLNYPISSTPPVYGEARIEIVDTGLQIEEPDWWPSITIGEIFLTSID